MKQVILVTINYVLIFFCLTMKTFSQDPAAINRDANPVLISKQFTFTEGPAADRNGIYFLPISPTTKYGNMICKESFQFLWTLPEGQMECISTVKATW